MTYSLSNNCTKNYYNRTLTVQVIVEDVVTWIFLKHSVERMQLQSSNFVHKMHYGRAVFTCGSKIMPECAGCHEI